ncbi:hypothetical protein PTKIN_Ptkin12aG0193400 [Pterospermum kingtungense]
MPNHVWNYSQAGALVASVLEGDMEGLGKALSSDKIVEPTRVLVILEMEAAKKTTIKAEALGARLVGSNQRLWL